MTLRRCGLAAALLWLLVGCVRETIEHAPFPGETRLEVPPKPEPDPWPMLVLISVEGLAPGRYLAPAADMPRLANRARQGVVAAGVETVMPAATYPAHASLITGQLPASHGVVADRVLGSHGVRDTRFWHASSLKAPTLWQRVNESKRGVASLAWPSTVGASIGLLLPDIVPTRRGETWLGVLRDATTPALHQLAVQACGGAPGCGDDPGPLRDRVLVSLACQIVAVPTPPSLLLVRLSQTGVALAGEGPDGAAASAAFAAADAEIERLVSCVDAAGLGPRTTFAVVGDHGAVSIHTEISPNVVLAEAGLMRQGDAASGLASWSALARSNGGTAFVYANRDGDALAARNALRDAGERTRVFDVIAAAEMLRLGADPDAWFGLAAEPGFAFGDASTGPLLRAAASRGAGGYPPESRDMNAGFVAWGRGIRRGIRVPEMRQTDIAPTLAPLLGIDLGETDGRRLVGALQGPAVAAGPEDAR